MEEKLERGDYSMLSNKENVLYKHIQQKEFLNCYFLYGKEPFLVKNAASKIVNKIVPDSAKGFNYNRFSGDEMSLDDVEDIVQMVPVLNEKRAVLLDGIFIDKFSKKDVDKIKEILEKIPETTVLIVTVTNPDITIRNNSKLKQLVNDCEKNGLAIDFGIRQKSELVKILYKYVVDQGGNINKSLLYFFIERCGESLDFLMVQMDKILAFAGDREIKKDDIVLLTEVSIENSVFDITKNILQGNIKNVIIILNNLLKSQTPPVVVLGAINMCFIDLYRAKCVQLAGENEKAISNFYSYKGKEFRIRNAIRDCSKYSITKLRECIIELSDIDFKIKTTGLDPKILIEKAIFSMMQGVRI